MRFNVNRNGKAQCPSCKSWLELKRDALCSDYYSFECCGRNYLIAINNEGLRAIRNGGEVKTPQSWWVAKANNGGGTK